MRDNNQHSLQQDLEWTGRNVVNPFVNSLVLEPVQAASQLANAAAHSCGGRDLLPQVQLLEVDKAEFGSAEFWAQNISSGVAMVLPYAGAAKIAGTGLRVAAGAMKLEAACARLGAGKQMMNMALRSEQILVHKSTASVLGAVAYDGLKDLHEGQTREGNMGRSAAQFGAYEALNSVVRRVPGGGVLGAVARNVIGHGVVGATGAAAGSVAESAINHKSIDLKEMSSEMLSGGALNLVLPHVQHHTTRLGSKVLLEGIPGLKKPGAVPASEFAEANGLSGKSQVLDVLLARNPLVKVQYGEHTSCDHKNGVVTLAPGSGAADLSHELHHLQKVRREGGGAGTVESRLEGESWARQIENKTARQSGDQIPEQNTAKDAIAEELTPSGETYREHFERETQAFAEGQDPEAMQDFMRFYPKHHGQDNYRAPEAKKRTVKSAQACLESAQLLDQVASRGQNSLAEFKNASAEERVALGWNEVSPGVWERQSDGASLSQALSRPGSNLGWRENTFFEEETWCRQSNGMDETVTPDRGMLTLANREHKYSLDKNGLERVRDVDAERQHYEALQQEERSKQQQRTQAIQQEWAKRDLEDKERRLLEQEKRVAERREQDRLAALAPPRDPLLKAMDAHADTFDGHHHDAEITQHRVEAVAKIALERGIVQKRVNIDDIRPIKDWLVQMFIDAGPYDRTVRHALCENPDVSERHHRHIPGYLEHLPELEGVTCRGSDIRAGGESIVFGLPDGKSVFKIMRPKFAEQLGDLRNYGKRPFDAELHSEIITHKIGYETVITYRQEKLEALTEQEYRNHPARLTALLEQIDSSGYRCPDMIGKHWQIGKNASGEWKLLDYGAAIKK